MKLRAVVVRGPRKRSRLAISWPIAEDCYSTPAELKMDRWNVLPDDVLTEIARRINAAEES